LIVGKDILFKGCQFSDGLVLEGDDIKGQIKGDGIEVRIKHSSFEIEAREVWVRDGSDIVLKVIAEKLRISELHKGFVGGKAAILDLGPGMISYSGIKINPEFVEIKMPLQIRVVETLKWVADILKDKATKMKPNEFNIAQVLRATLVHYE
jgi:hypothetical protein